MGWEPRASRPSVPARVPAGYSQPVLPTSSRTSSEAEWAAPMVPAAGAPGRACLAGPGLASTAQRPVRPRVHRGSGRRGQV